MRLNQESGKVEEYLRDLAELDYHHVSIRELNASLFHKHLTDMEKVKRAFEYVRDSISHSWDIQSSRVTKHAPEVLLHREGICYAKSNLLAAILRREGIPTGFCYQKLTLFDEPEDGYCIHALNAVYLGSLKRWIRLDARGNKPGVNARFSVDFEQLAFQVRPSLGEIDYPIIYTRPNEKTMDVLEKFEDAIEMYLNGLPQQIEAGA
ncbi:transglutaminase-like domain-containing protein [Alkalihalobacillus pseudalcaliphilus]|uniref:transglutaminase-like domain-containing protein n=1 Tax=Alkalihalobacillus pseudalcaliphilus TaxID=79884 RepID=UPI00064DF334|nr:transglutaminase family protein [Alkalihalobacillus pseudalcaliphilus]KMK75571.1 transglutaminase [Alkalihalobacillus pseudalcaliphilus]